ncbi:Protein of unknown function, partial [Gryllus bimaculatus]
QLRIRWSLITRPTPRRSAMAHKVLAAFAAVLFAAAHSWRRTQRLWRRSSTRRRPCSLPLWRRSRCSKACRRACRRPTTWRSRCSRPSSRACRRVCRLASRSRR